MAEASLNNASREEPWLNANQKLSLPSIPLITKLSARITHSLNCPTARAWRAVMREISKMMQQDLNQQEAIINTLLAHQGNSSDEPKRYDRSTSKVLEGCQKILESSLSPEAQLSAQALASIANNGLQHIQHALGFKGTSEYDINRVSGHSRTALDLLKLTLAHINKNPVSENIALKRNIDLCFDLVVFNPAIIRESQLEGWKIPKIAHYVALVEFTSYLAEPRFSQPLCQLLEYVKQIKNEIARKDPADNVGECKSFSENLLNLEKAILKGLSATHHGAKAVGILAKEFGQYGQDSNEFSALLHGLAQVDIVESREGCEYLVLALIESDEKIRKALLKHSLGEPFSIHFEADIEKFEKMMRLMTEYLTYPGAADICFQVVGNLSVKERSPLITIFKMIQQHDASAFLYLLPSSGEKIELPVLSEKECTRLRFLIACAEKLPISPFPNGVTHLSKYIAPEESYQ